LLNDKTQSAKRKARIIAEKGRIISLDFIGNKVLVQKTGYFQGYFVGLLAISDKVYLSSSINLDKMYVRNSRCKN